MEIRHVLVLMSFFLWAFSCEERVEPEDDLVTRIVGQVVDEDGVSLRGIPVTYVIASSGSRFDPIREVFTADDGTFEMFTRYATRCNFLDVNGYLNNWQSLRLPITESELNDSYAGTVTLIEGDVTDVDLMDAPIVIEDLAELRVIPFDTIIDYNRYVELIGGVELMLDDCNWGLSRQIYDTTTLRLRQGDVVRLIEQFPDSARQVVDTMVIDQVYQEVVL